MHTLAIKLGVFALAAGIACLLLVLITRGHWWRKLSTVQVIYDGQRVPDADVYRSPGGELLLNLNEVRGEARLFVIYPKINKVGVPNPRHFFFLPGYTYSRYVPPLVVYTDDPVKSGEAPGLQVTSNSVEFRSAGRHIQILIE